ncbi:hypothetical protein AB1Y20_023024 [Prymnesium parvum]|uniref:Histone acetyltransferase n=1 Tax=Prymnesium parvum TaxID=97485 RepID=A0AB34JEZ3_PRYPA
MLARRFSLPPVHEALYEPRLIPNAERDMSGTVLVRPSRETWMQMLGEMVQVTNEAVRRRAGCKRDESKPLSLEYMADRMDIDDPLFGYLAVTREEGWLQGYVTVTSFTTWCRTLRWDSLNPCLNLHDHDEYDEGGQGAGQNTFSTPRCRQCKVDDDGSLSMELQAELHAGDPDNEGIVWPRIAELALLGALGCGRWLVELIIDGLETEQSPYRFIVTHATEGSIAFYERLGFVRVGAIAEIASLPEANTEGTRKKHKGGQKTASMAERKEVYSAHTWYVAGVSETCASVAAAHGLDIFDVVWLNRRHYPELKATDVLTVGTRLQLPLSQSPEQLRANSEAMRQKWYTVTEESTLRKVAQVVGVDQLVLLDLNKHRIKGLAKSSILKKGTLLLIAGSTTEFEEYCHWTFPDDHSTAEPSYMMARKLRPPSERAPPSPTSTLARSQLLLVDERPPIKPSGKRAQYLQTPPPSNAVAPDLQLPPLSTPPCPQLFNRVAREMKKTKANADEEEWDILHESQA